jgi:hypothetical protein
MSDDRQAEAFTDYSRFKHPDIIKALHDLSIENSKNVETIKMLMNVDSDFDLYKVIDNELEALAAYANALGCHIDILIGKAADRKTPMSRIIKHSKE